jgi:hypothetical protein
MRKLILLAAALSLSLAAVSLSPKAESAVSYPCQQCTTDPDGFQCCVTCVCTDSGPFHSKACPQIGCAHIG